MERIGEGSAELAFTEQILEEDAKNYHCWQHRHWAMERFGLFTPPDQGGLDFVDRLLDEDVRNNSAWNHRYYVIEHTVGFTPEVCGSEVIRPLSPYCLCSPAMSHCGATQIHSTLLSRFCSLVLL